MNSFLNTDPVQPHDTLQVVIMSKQPQYKQCKGYEKEQDLVMLHGPDEAGQGHKEEEDAHADDASHHLKTGDQAEPLPPRCDANHQQAHHLQDRHTDSESQSLNATMIVTYDL